MSQSKEPEAPYKKLCKGCNKIWLMGVDGDYCGSASCQRLATRTSKGQEPHEHIYRKHYATSDEFCVICREPRCTNNADCLVHDGHPIPPLSLKGSEELENILLGTVSFQHILKFAPQSQRELMTFEIAKFFSALLSNKEREARISELKALLNNRIFEPVITPQEIQDRIIELTGVNHKRGGNNG